MVLGDLVLRKENSGLLLMALTSKQISNSETESKALEKFDFLNRAHILPQMIFFVAC